MPSDPIVLVHGGAHGAWCWQPMLDDLEAPVLAVDLPPRAIRGVPSAALGDTPTELSTTGLDDFASSVIADVDAAGFDRFMLVGHSMGGLTLPEVARRLPDRVTHLVFVSCIVPPEGGSIIDGLPDELREMTRAAVAEAIAGDLRTGMGGLDEATIRRMFCNDMTEDQAQFVLAHTGAEAPRVFTETATRVGIPAGLAKTYVRLLQDQALEPATQDEQIANLRASPGGDVRVIELDAGHDAMISAPGPLAAILNGIAAGGAAA